MVTAEAIDVTSLSMTQGAGYVDGRVRYAWETGAYDAHLKGDRLSWRGTVLAPNDTQAMFSIQFDGVRHNREAGRPGEDRLRAHRRHRRRADRRRRGHRRSARRPRPHRRAPAVARRERRCASRHRLAVRLPRHRRARPARDCAARDADQRDPRRDSRIRFGQRHRIGPSCRRSRPRGGVRSAGPRRRHRRHPREPDDAGARLAARQRRHAAGLEHARRLRAPVGVGRDDHTPRRKVSRHL